MIKPSFFIAGRILVPGILAMACVLFALTGCKSNSVTIDQHGTPEVGTLSGLIQLYDGTGKALSSDSGVSVVAMNSYDTIITNDSGQWLMRLGQGAYTLTFTKPGFGTVEQFYDTVISNDTTKLPNIVMSEPPTLSVGFNDYEIIAPSTLSFTCTMPKGENLSVVFCLSRDSASLASDPSNAEWTFLTSGAGSNYDGGFAATDGAFSIDSIAHGTVIYATVCVAGAGTNYQSFSSYYDPVAKREVYSALGPHSGIIAKTIP